MQTLAEYLGTAPERAVADIPLEDIADNAEDFCKAVLNSREFRSYIVNTLTLGNIPAAVLLRVMDMAGWQKPPDRVEHTGKIETVTEVRRIIVRANAQQQEQMDDDAAQETRSIH